MMERLAGERFVSPEIKNVARHELQHAVVAMFEGINIKEVSVIPTSEYRGVTRFYAGSVENNTLGFLSALMASRVSEPTRYTPQGLAGDNYQAQVLTYLIGGDQSTLFAAEMRAKFILAHFGYDLLDKCAEILASVGSVDKNGLIQIIQTAKNELKLERDLPFEIEKLKNEEPEDSQYNISIIEKTDNTVRIIKEYRCCDGINAHVPGCLNSPDTLKIKEPSTSSQSLDHTVFQFDSQEHLN
ncbi:hypothetical protein HYT02_02990 [Candidatus Gottesmanbacteria bacterium]|nr:hypothetical protein [Candidatus Gottesmanbacteria bacterium]